MDSNTQAVVAAAPQTQNAPALLSVLSQIVRNVDVTSLNAAIDNLAQHSDNLTPDEKQAGVQIVEQWNRDVIRAIEMRKQDLYKLADFFSMNAYKYSWGTPDELLEMIGPDVAQKTNTVAEFQAFMDAITALSLCMEEKPEKPILDDSMSKLQQLKLRQKFELEEAKHQIEVEKHRRRVHERFKAWMTKVRANPDVQTLLKTVKAQVRTLDKLSVECSQKSQLAKLNITIGNADVRQSLRDMLEFVKLI